ISKRKKAESALKKSEKAVRDMADNIPGVVFQLYSTRDNERGFYYLSPKTEELFGIFPDKRKFTELFIRQLHKDCKSDFIKSINNAFEQKKNWFFEGKFIKKNGDIRWFQGRAQPAVYEDEIIYNGVLLDITDSKVAEEKLKESEERFSILVNASFGGIGIHEKGKIIDCNQGLADITGYSIAELIGMNGLKLIAPESVEMVKNKIKSDYSGVYDAWGVRKNGSIYPVEIRGKNIPYYGKNLRVTEFRDISLRKEKEQKLKDNEESIRAIVNSLGEGVIAADTNGLVTRMNPNAEEITGLDFEYCAGKNISEVIRFSSDEKQITVTEVVEKIISAGTNMIISSSVGIVSSDENISLVSCTGAPVRNSKQEITGIVIVLRDISEEIKLQKQLQQSRKLESIGQLAGGIAHDFNNMLSGIMGAAELVAARNSSDEKTMKYTNMIIDAAAKSGNLTSKLLAFARKSTITKNTVDVHSLIRDTVSLLKRSVDKKVELQTDLKAENSIVKGDPSQLENVFLNLGINSSQAMPDGGKLVYSSKITEFDEHYCSVSPFDLSPGRYIEIEVRDTGTGIDKKNLDKIFDPYFTTKENGRGTGLGLAAVYGVVQQHKGSVSVYSETDHGTVFHINLPVVSAPHEKRTENKSDVFYGKGTILLIDDEKIIRNVGKNLLESFGYNVYLAENGKKGIELFEQIDSGIDLVILDMIMPEMNGKECFARLRSIDPGVKILMASGFSRDEDIKNLKEQGLSDFIRKPFQAAELSRAVYNIIYKS
ncbi:MAG: PAS domain-containing hybrid sensor histidine kinase/response regulator, partial [Thermodesulfobacteriota bacterium]